MTPQTSARGFGSSSDGDVLVPAWGGGRTTAMPESVDGHRRKRALHRLVGCGVAQRSVCDPRPRREPVDPYDIIRGASGSRVASQRPARRSTR